ncbi:hypothetical protein [Alkaliphilus crotonatoxidans]
MGQGVSLIIIMIFLILLFFAAFHLQQNRFAVADVKHSLNLSAKALAKAVNLETTNQEHIALGYFKENIEPDIDHGLLLTEFYEILYRNLYNPEAYESVKDRILLKVLVYYDRFYIADKQDRWSPPYYFNVVHEGQLYYLTTLNEIYTFNEKGEKQLIKITALNMTEVEREEIIINRINERIAFETSRFNEGVPLAVEIQNPASVDFEYIRNYGHFNVLDGLTFFVIYGEEHSVGIDQREFQFTNYNVVGYTLEVEKGMAR